MQDLQILSAAKVIGVKRKAPVEEKTEQKQKTAKSSFFTDAQMTQAVTIFSEILGKEAGVSVLPSGSHYVLHLRQLRGQVKLQTLEDALREFNKHYLVRQISIDLQRQFIDVRFMLGPGPCADLPNIVQIAQRVLPDISKSSIAKLEHKQERDLNDWRLISVLMTHCDHVLGPDTPEDIAVVVDTPQGQTITFSGWEDTKIARSNYLVRVKGYREIDIQHLRSFQHILPFHCHSPVIDFDQHGIQIQLERYNSAITGEVFALKADVSSPLS